MVLPIQGQACRRVSAIIFAALVLGLALPSTGMALEAGPDSHALADAAERRDMGAVKTLLKSPGIDVNAFGRDGTPALHWAVRADDVEVAKLLLAAGANAKLPNRLGVIPLYLACDNGNVEMMRVLLDAGADPNAQYPQGEPLLWGAIHSGVFEAAKLMIDRGANFNYIDSQSQQTTLMYAVRENEPKVVKLLIDLGANVNAKTRTGNTPGFVRPNSVAGFGHGVGIYRGGPPERGSRGLTTGGLTALLFAARDGRTEAAKILLDSGAELEVNNPDGITPLLMAISNNHPETAKFLIERGANLNATDWYGRTPIWSAVEVRNMDIDNANFKNGVDREPVLELIKLLLEKGANPNPRSKEAMPIRQFMLPATGTLEWVDFTGQTPFLYAARAGDVTVMKLLLKHGADPKIPTFQGTTPLMAAAGINWTVLQTYDEGAASLLEAVKLCYELGMDVNAVNSMGLTALHGAANRGSDDIIKFLVEKGAKLDVKDKEGRTPLTWAEGVFLATHPSQPKPSSIALINELMSKK
jgi:ankyrin repeat protein